MSNEETTNNKNFIEHKINTDLKLKKITEIQTRFPPEPNGFLHLGHAKAIYLNFGLAKKYSGKCNLRFDDTNPITEEQKYIDAIKEDVTWLGFSWNALHHTSAYFEQLYEYAVNLIKTNDAYVCSLSTEQIKEYRGTLITVGKDSPYRTRKVSENLELFTKMRNGEFAEGEHVLRAKIDMAAGNINMRDPIIYRILHAVHPHTGDKWCIYPMYDFAHCLSDAIEQITHSLCTLEFQDHRPLYDWFVQKLVHESVHPEQTEFSKLMLSHTLMSKRNLKKMVDAGLVTAWDDPRMPTLSGVRRRGYPAQAIKNFCAQAGMSKSESILDLSLLEEAVRDELNNTAPRIMAVLDPILVTIYDLEPDYEVELKAAINQNIPELGMRKISFSRQIYIERNDFMEHPTKKFHRLSYGTEVRLRYSYIIKCEKIIKDVNGIIKELICSHDATTLGKNPPDRKVKGVIHWVCAKNNISAQINVFDRLFKESHPHKAQDWDELLSFINSDSIKIIPQAFIEKSWADYSFEQAAQPFQFERLGYFVLDKQESIDSNLVFNKTVGLKDSWDKIK